MTSSSSSYYSFQGALRIVMATVVIEMICIVRAAPAGCVWRSAVSATLPESQQVAPSSECQTGQLSWNNPRGALTATFTQDGQDPVFTLCFTATNGTLTEVYDESGETSVPLDPEGDPVCVSSIDGQAIVRFVATENLDTLTLIEYFKQEPP